MRGEVVRPSPPARRVLVILGLSLLFLALAVNRPVPIVHTVVGRIADGRIVVEAREGSCPIRRNDTVSLLLHGRAVGLSGLTPLDTSACRREFALPTPVTGRLDESAYLTIRVTRMKSALSLLSQE